MKTIQEIITEKQSSKLTKLVMLIMMIPYQIWKEYKMYDDFFGKLGQHEKYQYRTLYNKLSDLENNGDNNSTFSTLKSEYEIIYSLSNYMLKQDLPKYEKKIWEEIKDNVI